MDYRSKLAAWENFDRTGNVADVTAGALTSQPGGGDGSYEIDWSRRFNYTELAQLMSKVFGAAEPLSHQMNDLAVTLSDFIRDTSRLHIRNLPEDSGVKMPSPEQLKYLEALGERLNETQRLLRTFSRSSLYDHLKLFRKW